jgi:predicted PurR-regulated permease PerM
MNIKLDDDYNIWPYAVVILSVILVSLMVFPLLDGMILGVVFAYIGRPIRNIFGNRKMLDSLLATSCIVLPIFLVITLGTLEIANQLIWIVDNKNEFLDISSGFIRDLGIPPIFLDQLIGSLKGLLDIVIVSGRSSSAAAAELSSLFPGLFLSIIRWNQFEKFID